MTAFTTTARRHPVIASAALRAATLGLAIVVSLGLLGGMSRLADNQHDDVLLAQAKASATQVVTVTGHRLPKA